MICKRVKKSGILLVIVGSLIGIGIVLSFYGNYLLFEQLAQGEGEISFDNDLVVEVELDHTKSKTGIYAVSKIDSQSATITASILDPFGTSIESQSLSDEAFEGLFVISTSGTYKLLIQNSGEPITVFGVIGPEPDSDKQTLAFVSIYILVSGLVGMIIVTFYIIINRRRSAS